MSGNSSNTLKSRVTPFFEEEEYFQQPQNTFVPRGGLFTSNPNGTDTCSGVAGFNFYGAGVQIDPVASGQTVGVYIPGGTITELTGSSLASTVTLGTSYTTLQNGGSAPYQYVLGAGVYYLSANIPIVDSTSADVVSAQFYNVTNSNVVGVPITEGATGQPFMLTLFNKLTLTGTCTIALQAKNATSARGTAGLNGVVFDVISMSGGNAYSWPIITSFSPVYGLSGTSVTITGAGFTGATAVSFYGTAASSFTVVSDTSITCTVPTLAGSSTGAISVATGAGTAVSSGTYYYRSTVPNKAPQNISTTNLILLLAMTEGAGTTTADASSFAKTFTLPTGATWSTDNNGLPCISLASASTSVAITGADTSFPTGSSQSFTTVCKFKTSASVVNFGIFGWGAGTGDLVDLQYYVPGGYIGVAWGGSGGYASGGGALSANTWYVAVATYNGSTNVWTIYLNGTLLGTATHAATTVLNGTSASVGAGNNVTTNGNCTYDYAAIWSRVLTGTEISSLV